MMEPHTLANDMAGPNTLAKDMAEPHKMEEEYNTSQVTMTDPLPLQLEDFAMPLQYSQVTNDFEEQMLTLVTEKVRTFCVRGSKRILAPRHHSTDFAKKASY
ncbi:hypothetical protein LOK49_LG13G00887 [Camellia lanceoleosa]|uniref:Uncharacterized protein n=1 Tax=Camellia lanceoleosa TaxID=1840588 RepID=A0ACC0FFQ9_9ERIC|nr:hypothetical protein LOK49_LG13G00887 [Camellia lanceoleosa]